MHERKKRNDTGKQIRLITYILNNSVWYIQVWRGEWNKIIFADVNKYNNLQAIIINPVWNIQT